MTFEFYGYENFRIMKIVSEFCNAMANQFREALLKVTVSIPQAPVVTRH